MVEVTELLTGLPPIQSDQKFLRLILKETDKLRLLSGDIVIKSFVQIFELDAMKVPVEPD